MITLDNLIEGAVEDIVETSEWISYLRFLKSVFEPIEEEFETMAGEHGLRLCLIAHDCDPSKVRASLARTDLTDAIEQDATDQTLREVLTEMFERFGVSAFI